MSGMVYCVLTFNTTKVVVTLSPDTVGDTQQQQCQCPQFGQRRHTVIPEELQSGTKASTHSDTCGCNRSLSDTGWL